ncbi:hypothetical protein BDY17DRAFT_162201 [Neohortaea acidophila]|uniref:Uncharacterized protein n=1 Tax=Neohortaea acidophila TaxID=245834 RepID=A0A6A6PSC8_9PEZI|nr:uncharacterized protein BDY17DRAFT_162201 [Neohortaea acidophila]KAF2482574.1 hypothetical protein BDY17DRAFT_162201 [Neohortaea acidophila]
MENQDPDTLLLPSPEKLREIAEKQDAKAKEIAERRKREGLVPDDRDAAAQLIQKNYRGYRTRRALQGYGLDSNARWIEVLKDGENVSFCFWERWLLMCGYSEVLQYYQDGVAQ